MLREMSGMPILFLRPFVRTFAVGLALVSCLSLLSVAFSDVIVWTGSLPDFAPNELPSAVLPVAWCAIAATIQGIIEVRRAMKKPSGPKKPT